MQCKKCGGMKSLKVMSYECPLCRANGIACTMCNGKGFLSGMIERYRCAECGELLEPVICADDERKNRC